MPTKKIKLTKEVLTILSRQGIKPEDVFDARNWPPRIYRPFMEQEGKIVAINVTVCKNGHSLRSKRGVCIVCSPGHLSFAKRKPKAGHIYILSSASTGLIKIGFTEGSMEARVRQLNKDCYANTNDWVNYFSAYQIQGGQLEIELSKAMSAYTRAIHYYRGSHKTYTREVFECEPHVALDLLGSVILGLSPQLTRIAYPPAS